MVSFLLSQSTSEEVATTTVVGRTGSPGGTSSGAGAYDVTRMREEEFERLTVYIVPDMPCEPGTPNRAERTLPRSLALRPSAVLSTPNTPVCRTFHENSKVKTRSNFSVGSCVIFLFQTEGVWSTGVIPRGTRFGPFEGTRTPNKPNDKISWRYYWRVSTHSI